MKVNSEYPIVIIGAGMVGLNLALLLAAQNFSIILIESQHALDNRVSAIHLNSQAILKKTGCWDALEKENYTDLLALQVWDDSGHGEICFDGRSTLQKKLGFIVKNQAIVDQSWQLAMNHPNIEILYPDQPTALSISNELAVLTLKSGRQITTSLLVGADGPYSWLRTQGGFTFRENSYQQKAIVASVSIEKPHQNQAYQSFLPSGSLGLLPLPNPYEVSLVWSLTIKEFDRLFAKNDADFLIELTQAVQCRLGKMTALSPRKAFPLVMRHVNDYVRGPLVLVGDAAHTMHPLAGQGVNLGFADIHALQLALKNEQNYQRVRYAENQRMLCSIKVIQQIFLENNPMWVTLRSLGMRGLNRCQFLKKCLIEISGS